MKKLVMFVLLLLPLASAIIGDGSEIQENQSGTMRELNLEFDRNQSKKPFDSPLSGLSYTDGGLKNPNGYIKVCSNSDLEGESFQLFYASESGNITQELLTNKAEVVNQSGRCSEPLDIDISAFKANYPGRPYLGLIQGGEVDKESLFKLDQSLKGDFNLDIRTERDLDGGSSSTKIKVGEILDNDGKKILTNRKPETPLIISITNSTGSFKEASTPAYEFEKFNTTFKGGESIYVNGKKILGVEVINSCGEINRDNSYYLLNQSIGNSNDTCVRLSNVDDAVFDFSQRMIDGNGNESLEENKCGLEISESTDISVGGARVQQFSKGICVTNSDGVRVSGTYSQVNDIGVYTDNSEVNLSDITLENNKYEIKAPDSIVSTEQVNLKNSSNMTGVIESVAVKGVEEKDVPENPTDDLESLNQNINITSVAGSSSAEDLGFHYSSVNKTGLNPKALYKFDQAATINGTELEEEELDTRVLPTDQIIKSEETITEFSIISAYGENIEGGGTTDSGDEGDGTGEGEGESGSGAGGGAGPGGTTPRPEPEPEPEPRPVDINLTLDNESIELQQGEAGEVGFSVENMGEVPANSISVGPLVRDGWQAGPDQISVPQGSLNEGEMLLEVYEAEEPSIYEVPVRVNSSKGSQLDQEILEVEVSPRAKLDNIDIEDAPSFVEVSPGKEDIAFLAKNSGNFDYENVTLDVRNADKCINGVEGTNSLEKDEKKSLSYSIDFRNVEETCNAVFVFESKEKGTLGFTPSRIEVKDRSIIERTGILPIIVILWTMFTIYWVVIRE